MAIEEAALAKIRTSIRTPTARYQPPDRLLHSSMLYGLYNYAK